MRKNRIFYVILLIAALSLLLTACGLFKTDKTIGETQISISGAAAVEDDIYIVELGRQFELTLTWDNDKIKSPDVKWFRAAGGGMAEELIDYTSKKLSYRFLDFSEEVYTFTASANGVLSENSIKIRLKYAELKPSDIHISSSTHRLNEFQTEGGIPQYGITQKNAEASEVALTAQWEDDFLAPGSDYLAKWYVGSSEYAQGNSISYSLGYIPEKQTSVVITLRIYYGEGERDFFAFKITLLYVEGFSAADSVELSAGEGVVSVAKDTYYLQTESEDCSPVSLRATVSPSSVDPDSKVVWTIRNKSGERLQETYSEEFVLTPVYGKNVITATVGNVASRHIVIYALPQTKYNSVEDIVSNTFVWDGNVQSGYLADDYDIDCLISYLVSLHKTAEEGKTVINAQNNVFEIYLQPDEWKADSVNVSSLFQNKVAEAINQVDESGSFSISYTARKICLMHDSVFGNAQGRFPSESTVTQQKQLTHFSTSAVPRTAIPADGLPETLKVVSSDDLYRALGWGYQPEFTTDAEGIKLAALYQTARELLMRIIDDGMSDFEKVRAIYEWIVTSVAYDTEIATAKISDLQKIKYNAFYLEGVFTDARAVCDGKSKAFVLLCGMEGIRAKRIVGKAASSSEEDIRDMSEKELEQLSGHAWNKVLLDADGNGVKEWYVADTTWGDIGQQKGYGFYAEYMTYKYFLVNDDSIASTHYSEDRQPAAQSVFDAYAATTITAAGKTASLHVRSKEELSLIVQRSKQLDNIAIEIRVSIEGISDGNKLNALIKQIKRELYPYDLNFNAYVFTFDEAEGIYLIKAYA